MSDRGLKLGRVDEQRYPWSPGSATGIGSMPGTDPLETARVIAGELPGFPHLAELPGRGPGSDITGRAVALLVDMPAVVTVRGWQLAERAGLDRARARSALSADLDAMEEALEGYTGPLKVQVCGPWTLAATLELPHRMTKALADPGAVADLAASLAEGTASHVADVAKRVPGATLVLQLDEPALPAVAEGRVPSASGLSRIAPTEPEPLRERLATVITATSAYTAVHCCDSPGAFGIIAQAGADAVSADLSRLTRDAEDQLAEVLEAGLGLLAGVPAGQATSQDGAGIEQARLVAGLWRRIGLAPRAEQVVITPACGLAGASPEQARAALRACREAGRILPEMMEVGG